MFIGIKINFLKIGKVTLFSTCQNDHKIDREFEIVASICRKIHKTNTENQRRTWGGVGGGGEGQKKIEKDCIKVNFKGEK